MTAVLLNKALKGKEKTMTRAEMEKIVAALPYPNNYFAVKILQKYPAADQNPEPAPADQPDASNDTDSDTTSDTTNQ